MSDHASYEVTNLRVIEPKVQFNDQNNLFQLYAIFAAYSQFFIVVHYARHFTSNLKIHVREYHIVHRQGQRAFRSEKVKLEGTNRKGSM